MEAQQGKVVAPLKFGSFFEGIHFEITNVILQIDRRGSAQIIVNTFRLLFRKTEGFEGAQKLSLFRAVIVQRKVE